MSKKKVLLIIIIVMILIFVGWYWLSPCQQIKLAVLSEINSACNLSIKEKWDEFKAIKISEHLDGEIRISRDVLFKTVGCGDMEYFQYAAKGVERYFNSIGETKSCVIRCFLELGSMPSSSCQLTNPQGKFDTFSIRIMEVGPPIKIGEGTLDIVEVVNYNRDFYFDKNINIFKCFPNLKQVNIEFEISDSQKDLLESIVPEDCVINYEEN